MNTDEIVERVRRCCPELDPLRAHDVTIVGMSTLAEYLGADQAHVVASVLPAVLAEAFDAVSRETHAKPDETSLAAFEQQLVVRAEVDEATAADLAWATVRVLRTVLVEEHAQHRLDLPPALDCLLVAAPADGPHPAADKRR